MPLVLAIAIDPGPRIVKLGLLSVAQRTQLEAEVDAAEIPSGAPPAGLGGASTSDGVNEPWLIAGASFLALSCLASIAFWRRRGTH